MNPHDDTFNQLRKLLKKRRYDPKAYGLILAVVEFAIQRMGVRRHITGRQLLDSLVELMVKKHGLLAQFILKEWGINSSENIGEIVFDLVEAGLLKKRPEDTIQDFEGYDLFGEIEQRALNPPVLDLSGI